MSAAAAQSLDELLDGLAWNAPALPVTGIAMDSSQVKPGDVFLAVQGRRTHGLSGLPEALERGAGAIVWEPSLSVEQPEAMVPCIEVEQLSRHVGEIAARFHGRPSERMFMAGITGTDGKTSTAHLVAQALEFLGQPCAYLGTLGSGRPDTLLAASHTTPDAVSLQAALAHLAESGIGNCAMEVSSHALDQYRVAGVSFNAVALTNLTRDHLDYHRTMQHYAASKRRLFEPTDRRAMILNRDDEYGAQWIQDFSRGEHAARCVVYGLEGPAPSQGRYVLGRALHLREDGVALQVETERAGARLHSRLLGRFNAYNLLAATAVLLEAGVPLDDAARALSNAKTVPGRIEAFRGPRADALAVVDYAHTPKALEQVLLALQEHVRGRLWCVFGCGGDRDAGKRPLMGAIAARLADEVVITDDNPRGESPSLITDAIVDGIPEAMRHRVKVEHDRRQAIESSLRQAGKGDIVLIAGKGHETDQILAGQRLAFSDRAVVAECVGQA